MEPKTDDPTCNRRRCVGLAEDDGKHLRSSKPLSRSARFCFVGRGNQRDMVGNNDASSPRSGQLGVIG